MQHTITLPVEVEILEKPDGKLEVIDMHMPVIVQGKPIVIDVGGLQKYMRGNFRRYITEDHQDLLKQEIK